MRLAAAPTRATGGDPSWCSGRRTAAAAARRRVRGHRCRREASRPTRSGCTTWAAASSNGSLIAGPGTTMALPRTDPRGIGRTAANGPYAVVRGSGMPTPSGPRTATSTIRPCGIRRTGSAWFSRPRQPLRDCLFQPRPKWAERCSKVEGAGPNRAGLHRLYRSGDRREPDRARLRSPKELGRGRRDRLGRVQELEEPPRRRA
jgi:hypothetical protein